MKKIRVSLTGISICIFAFSAWATELKVGLAELDYPPYYFETDGQYDGAAVEISQTIAQSLGYKLVFLRFPWKRIQTLLHSGAVEMMILYFKTPERAKDVIYVDVPHIYESSDLFVAKGSEIKFNGHLSDLVSYRFGNVSGYSHGKEYDNADALHKQEVNNEQQLVRILTNGRIDIGVGNKPVIIRYAERLGVNDKIRFLEPPIDIGANYIAFSKARKDAQKLADEFSAQLGAYIKTAEYKAVLNKYSFTIKN